jgi:hypothetical protein
LEKGDGGWVESIVDGVVGRFVRFYRVVYQEVVETAHQPARRRLRGRRDRDDDDGGDGGRTTWRRNSHGRRRGGGRSAVEKIRQYRWIDRFVAVQVFTRTREAEVVSIRYDQRLCVWERWCGCRGDNATIETRRRLNRQRRRRRRRTSTIFVVLFTSRFLVVVFLVGRTGFVRRRSGRARRWVGVVLGLWRQGDGAEAGQDAQREGVWEETRRRRQEEQGRPRARFRRVGWFDG